METNGKCIIFLKLNRLTWVKDFELFDHQLVKGLIKMLAKYVLYAVHMII